MTRNNILSFKKLLNDPQSNFSRWYQGFSNWYDNNLRTVNKKLHMYYNIPKTQMGGYKDMHKIMAGAVLYLFPRPNMQMPKCGKQRCEQQTGGNIWTDIKSFLKDLYTTPASKPTPPKHVPPKPAKMPKIVIQQPVSTERKKDKPLPKTKPTQETINGMIKDFDEKLNNLVSVISQHKRATDMSFALHDEDTLKMPFGDTIKPVTIKTIKDLAGQYGDEYEEKKEDEEDEEEDEDEGLEPLVDKEDKVLYIFEKNNKKYLLKISQHTKPALAEIKVHQALMDAKPKLIGGIVKFHGGGVLKIPDQKMKKYMWTRKLIKDTRDNIKSWEEKREMKTEDMADEAWSDLSLKYDTGTFVIKMSENEGMYRNTLDLSKKRNKEQVDDTLSVIYNIQTYEDTYMTLSKYIEEKKGAPCEFVMSVTQDLGTLNASPLYFSHLDLHGDNLLVAEKGGKLIHMFFDFDMSTIEGVDNYTVFDRLNDYMDKRSVIGRYKDFDKEKLRGISYLWDIYRFYTEIGKITGDCKIESFFSQVISHPVEENYFESIAKFALKAYKEDFHTELKNAMGQTGGRYKDSFYKYLKYKHKLRKLTQAVDELL